LFTMVDKKYKLYTRRAAASRLPLDLALPEAPAANVLRTETAGGSDSQLQKAADRAVVENYGPAGVVVDEQLNIVQFRGQVGAFLEPAAGVASLNMLKMAREGLQTELRNAVQQCRKEHAPVRRDGVRVKSNGGVRIAS